MSVDDDEASMRRYVVCSSDSTMMRSVMNTIAIAPMMNTRAVTDTPLRNDDDDDADVGAVVVDIGGDDGSCMLGSYSRVIANKFA